MITLLESGHIKDYDVVIHDNLILVMKGEKVITQQRAAGLQDFLEKAKDIRLGWGEFQDFEVIYLYDKADENFGFAVNLQDDILSEWGYAPFAVAA